MVPNWFGSLHPAAPTTLHPCSGTLLSASAIMLSSSELRPFILDGERITPCQNVIGQAKFPNDQLPFEKPCKIGHGA